ncbi:hypothetical protein [Erwinia sp. S59]|uniref:hypothetical protein n=1 Tax=Erwinia sp. S59 TaxID=2769340 RepID=UPI00190E53D1|nr:hypothetical protein [Erwinia sp. S59]MBK0093436.1 hypothetical protein [Erwinia sp. S59]
MTLLISFGLPFLAILVSYFVYTNSVRKDKSSIVIELAKEIDKSSPNKLLVEFLFSSAFKCGPIPFNDIAVLFKHHHPYMATEEYLKVKRHVNAFRLRFVSGLIRVDLNEGWNTNEKIRKGKMMNIFFALPCYLISAIFINSHWGGNPLKNIEATLHSGQWLWVIIEGIFDIGVPVMTGYFTFVFLRIWQAIGLIESSVKFLKSSHYD